MSRQPHLLLQLAQLLQQLLALLQFLPVVLYPLLFVKPWFGGSRSSALKPNLSLATQSLRPPLLPHDLRPSPAPHSLQPSLPPHSPQPPLCPPSLLPFLLNPLAPLLHEGQLVVDEPSSPVQLNLPPSTAGLARTKWRAEAVTAALQAIEPKPSTQKQLFPQPPASEDAVADREGLSVLSDGEFTSAAVWFYFSDHEVLVRDWHRAVCVFAVVWFPTADQELLFQD
eukprot:superscaffoldBa00000071_g1117